MPAIRVIALAGAAVLLSLCAASAQTWPSRPVTMLVPFPAGGTADLLARETAQALSEELGQQFVVENRAGAGGNLAASRGRQGGAGRLQLAVRLAGAGGPQQIHVQEPAVRSVRELVPVVLVVKSPIAIVAGLDAPVASFQAMVDQAKAKPGTLTVGHAGIGSMAHIALELVQQRAGIKLTGVPYKGGAPMVTDLLGGHLPLSSDLVSNFIRLAQDKKVRLLAVTTTRRMSDLPDVPTVQELIHAPFEATAWFAIMAPAGTPADIVQKINAVANRYLQSAKGKEPDRAAGGGSGRRHTGGRRGVREERDRKVGASDQGGEHFAQLGHDDAKVI